MLFKWFIIRFGTFTFLQAIGYYCVIHLFIRTRKQTFRLLTNLSFGEIDVLWKMLKNRTIGT